MAITHNHEDDVGGLITPDGAEAFTGLERVPPSGGGCALEYLAPPIG
ncbi:hypothetical protein [Nonomuraea sp. NPDC001699]